MRERFPDRRLGTLTLWSSSRALINARQDPDNAVRHMLEGMGEGLPALTVMPLPHAYG